MAWPSPDATWPNIDDFLRSIGVPIGEPTIPQTEGGVHSSTSLHYAHRARDYGNLDTPGGDAGCDRIFRALEQYAQGAFLLQELFWNPIGCWQNGRRIGPVDGHWNHVHAGLAVGALLPVVSAPLPKPKPKWFEEESTMKRSV